jgi:hypothetical protein
MKRFLSIEKEECIMLMRLKQISGGPALALCGLLLVAALLAACGGTTSTTTPTPTTPPTSTPTSAAMATLAGNGFTINYPQSLQLSKSGSNRVTLTNSAGSIKMTITVVPNPNGKISADSLVSTAITAQKASLKNVQAVSVPPTVKVGGESWNQQAVSGTQRLNAADVMMQSVVIANVHPGNTATSKGYTIVSSAPQSTFSEANTTYFQPILQSFKFV